MPFVRTQPDADYYHRVVDCQWACPAHTPVPEYIRLIAQGRYTDAYLVNRKSNLFPGVLGRVCDRPCEPACRRTRVEEEAVAICRLKRVASDFRDEEIRDLLPIVPQKKNGKRVALIGSGPASLAVAENMLLLGYEIDLFEKQNKLGGAMRASVPLFRLPESVLDEEIGYVVNRGVRVFLNTPIKSLRALMEQNYDAYFVGTGAPLGRDLNIAGRNLCGPNIEIGLDFLANIAFGHFSGKLPARVMVIGGGNTAMDCARTAKRFGANEVVVVAPEPFEQMLASPWEKLDAQEENINFRNLLLPKEFVVEQGKLSGVRFTCLERAYNADKRWDPQPSGAADEMIAVDHVILAIGQNTAFPFIEPDLGIEFNNSLLQVNPDTFQTSLENVFVGGDAAFGPKNIIWAVAHGHNVARSMHQYLSGQNPEFKPKAKVKLISQKMGMHEWSYDQSYAPDHRYKVPHVEVKTRFKDPALEVELGFDASKAAKEAARCLNCDVQTVFNPAACIECDACVDICPTECLTIVKDDVDSAKIALKLSAPPLRLETQSILVSAPLKDTGRSMVKDEDVCLHCGLCAERCPTSAWDMQKAVLDLEGVCG